MATSLPVPAVPYGVVTLDGKRYLERFQLFTMDITINAAHEEHLNQRLTLPGVSPFLLKGLTRDITKPGQSGSFNPSGTFFLFRLVNAPGASQFFTGGLGVINERVSDLLCFGSGQFPFPLIPPVPIDANGSLIFDVIDFEATSVPANYPYIIHLGFQGAYLIPWNNGGN